LRQKGYTVKPKPEISNHMDFQDCMIDKKTANKIIKRAKYLPRDKSGKQAARNKVDWNANPPKFKRKGSFYDIGIS
jgi:hypothetical protein